jgi:hypothetical protein
MLFSFSNTDHAPWAATVTALSAYLTAFDIVQFSSFERPLHVGG